MYYLAQQNGTLEQVKVCCFVCPEGTECAPLPKQSIQATEKQTPIHIIAAYNIPMDTVTRSPNPLESRTQCPINFPWILPAPTCGLNTSTQTHGCTKEKSHHGRRFPCRCGRSPPATRPAGRGLRAWPCSATKHSSRMG